MAAAVTQLAVVRLPRPRAAAPTANEPGRTAAAFTGRVATAVRIAGSCP